MQEIATIYYKYARRVSVVFYLNLLWTLFSCFGLVVFGLAPATTVLYKLSARTIKGEEFPIFNTYWAEFKEEFLKANCLVGLLVITLYLLLVQYQILSLYNNLYFLIARYIIIGFVLVYLMVTVFILPVFAKYPEAKLKEILRIAFIFSVGRPFFSIATLIGLTAINWCLINFVPVIYIFVGVSLNVFVHQWFVDRKIDKLTEEEGQVAPAE